VGPIVSAACPGATDPEISPHLTIDLSAVAANARFFAHRTGTAAVMAVVKADAFGHGDVDVAATALANGATWLGVTTLDEAFRLRSHGIEAPILSWLNPLCSDFERAVFEHIDIAAPSVAHLAAVASAAERAGRQAQVHLHIDTGMARDGSEPEQWPALCAQARSLELRGAVRVVGVMGHLGCADDPADPANAAGRRIFADGTAAANAHGLRPVVRHLAATSAALTDPRSRFDLCRIGAGLFGIDPTGTTPLRPALTLTAPVVTVRRVPAGTWVGYGHTYRTRSETQLALLPIGYADGIPRAASERGSVWLAGRRRPVAGVVSMDQLVVDVADARVRIGDGATIFGPGRHGEPTTADWARWASTIEHEIVTGIGQRVTRQVVADGALEAAPIDAATPAPGPRRTLDPAVGL